MILSVWSGLAVLTVGVLNVWKFVVLRPNEPTANHRFARRPIVASAVASAGARSSTSSHVAPRRRRSGIPVSSATTRIHAELGPDRLPTESADHLAAG